MALTWPNPPLFNVGFHCCIPPDQTGTCRERLLCLELSTSTQLNVMSPPLTQPHCELSSHVHRIEACHRLWRDRRLGATAHATRTRSQSSSSTTTDPNSKFVDSIVEGNGTDHPSSSSEETSIHHHRDVELVSERLGTDGHAFPRVRQTYTTT